ncbi:hypothetical protein [Paraburkholderia antibiotica]|uniref:Uncharacterized protein n=1 Tax=Paraburkholderia antibiotica TaxID=2728839 RepID=A0A7Y0FFM1_9BURK|nr:hypothetical protein [Paraburkholderia antibiotica]NML34351.1 hypothetical protein [Paraburkholderia antibiotica]
MMQNYLVWGTVENFASRYERMDDDGNFVPDVKSQEIVRRSLVALRRFFADNELVTVKMFDAKGDLIDREYRKDDFTAEGVELIRRKEGAWLKSEGSKKDPPDMKLLEKALAEIRAGK